MKRLRDIDAPSPLVEKAQALIDSVDAVPESRERMARIRREIDRPRGAIVALRRLPALALAALVVLFGASAFAAVRYLAMPLRRAMSAASAPAAQEHATRRTHADGQRPSAVPSAAPATPAAVPVAAPAEDGHGNTSANADASVHAPAHARTAPRVPAPRTEAALHTNDSALVHSALTALRRDHDPALAARLLAEHRAHYPEGPLAEEALSLQIEAALALHDARAREFAHEYVTRFPSGRYLSVAQRALAGSAP